MLQGCHNQPNETIKTLNTDYHMMSNKSFLPSMNLTELDCPVFTEQELYLINQFNVWIEGVTQTCVAIPGFLGK